MRYLFIFLGLLASCQQLATTGPSMTKDTVVSSVRPDSAPATAPGIYESTDPSIVPNPFDYTVIPGQRIGKIYLHLLADSIKNFLGKPDFSDAAMGKAWQAWYAAGDDSLRHELDVYTVADFTEAATGTRVRQIRVTSPAFVTVNGLRTGISYDQWRQSFPSLQKASGYWSAARQQKITVYDSIRDGLAVETDTTGRTVAVQVHPPGDSLKGSFVPALLVPRE